MSYGKILYGTSLFADESISESTEIQPVDLLQYLPGYYRSTNDFRKLMNTEEEEIGLLWFESDSVLKQFFVSTATWGLSFWESELRLTVDPTKPVEWRREIIKAKLRGAGTTTKQMIKDAAAAFSGGEVDVIEYPEEYRFVVKFIGVKGIPSNMPGFIEMIERIKPAHLVYEFKYTYTAWNHLEDLTWGQANAMSWNELKVYEGE